MCATRGRLQCHWHRLTATARHCTALHCTALLGVAEMEMPGECAVHARVHTYHVQAARYAHLPNSHFRSPSSTTITQHQKQSSHALCITSPDIGPFSCSFPTARKLNATSLCHPPFPVGHHPTVQQNLSPSDTCYQSTLQHLLWQDHCGCIPSTSRDTSVAPPLRQPLPQPQARAQFSNPP